ncbi:hypothetical protein AVEN_61535-1 [Araneus ventricosus]|uniref:Uncharacterized protein n=1 Tax=Araneus ventricosus TaxID=182803 RepID=A0A4Y2I846_ARAVE|nr:hypothetical protein AVEN_61535-1 [Araneus ventricosus]
MAIPIFTIEWTNAIKKRISSDRSVQLSFPIQACMEYARATGIVALCSSYVYSRTSDSTDSRAEVLRLSNGVVEIFAALGELITCCPSFASHIRHINLSVT